MNTLLNPVDVHLRCHTPDFAASTFRLLKANNVHPALLVGALVVVPTDGSTEEIDTVVDTALATRLVPAEGVSLTVPTDCSAWRGF